MTGPGQEQIRIKPLQPLVWISIAPPSVLELPPLWPRFPAVIDTGFNQTLLMQQHHVQGWAGVSVADLLVFPGEAAGYRGQAWPFYIADIWLHRNISGTQDFGPITTRPYCLETYPGILIVTPEQREQRLPILGMRALARNRMRLDIEFPAASLGHLSVAASDAV